MILSNATLHHYCTACGDCLLWNLGCNRQGYPSARIEGKVVNVRRWLWEQKSGRKLGKGQVIRSTCNTPRCLGHLVAATRGELTARSYASGNRDRAREYVNRVNAYIERGLAKLDWDKARQIRARRDEGERALAKAFGVDKTTIRQLLAGKTWFENPYQSSVFAWSGQIAVNDDEARAA